MCCAVNQPTTSSSSSLRTTHAELCHRMPTQVPSGSRRMALNKGLLLLLLQGEGEAQLRRVLRRAAVQGLCRFAACAHHGVRVRVWRCAWRGGMPAGRGWCTWSGALGHSEGHSASQC